jgi:methylphosphotriester-DNA--protein-cysteine methyltransferase
MVQQTLGGNKMNKIQEFKELHSSKDTLFSGNAWDLLSALTLEKVGFKAIGTTSWGIANSLGFADGELIVENAGFRACKRCQPEVEISPNIGTVRNVISFLVTHYRQNLVLKDIADHVGVSSYYLDRLFKQETSETPRAYLEKIRVDKVAHLLKNTDRTNLEICCEVGFQSPSNFYKVFRRLKNCSPSEYRILEGKELR